MRGLLPIGSLASGESFSRRCGLSVANISCRSACLLLTGFTELLGDLIQHRIELRPHIVISGAGHMAIGRMHPLV
jgi:hypothetical protein